MPEINKLISSGVKRIKIYELMQTEHGLKCTHRTFRYWVTRHSADELAEAATSPPISENPPIPPDAPSPASADKPALKLADPSKHADDRKQATDVDLASKIVRAETPEFKLRG